MARPATSRPPKVTKPVPPYFRCDWDIPAASALQALERGEANPDQQKRALAWIRHRAAMIGEVPFFPGEPDAGAFVAGRQFVGKKIDDLLVIDVRKLLEQQQRATPQGD